jgi:uncharacterized membrane protein (UPF0182 family)
MLRNVIDRVEKLAPFLDYDGDPYPAIVDGRLVWILDGYTTSNQYPYSQQANGLGGISGDVNYVRNSVKVTIDAYEGTVKFFVIDPDDPIVRAYAKAFPDLFTPGREMPKAVREHLRYPEDLFRVQSNVFANYHVTDPRRFYQGSERWLLTPDPNVAVAPIATTSGTQGGSSSRAPQITADTKRQDPYYLYIRLPGDKTESFLILQPFVPVSNDNKQTRLISFMTAKSDPATYGDLEAFVMPQGTNVTGPVQAANNIQSDVNISEQLTLLSRGGSSVRLGNLQLIPVGESVVYIQPIFVQQTGQQGFPQFRFVAVFVPGGDKNPVIATSVQQGLNELFNLSTPEPEGPDTPPTTEDPDVTVADLLRDAAAKFTEADEALKAGDLGRYQELVAEAQDLVNRAARVLSGEGSGSGSTTTTTTSPTAQAQQASAP